MLQEAISENSIMAVCLGENEATSQQLTFATALKHTGTIS